MGQPALVRLPHGFPRVKPGGPKDFYFATGVELAVVSFLAFFGRLCQVFLCFMDLAAGVFAGVTSAAKTGADTTVKNNAVKQKTINFFMTFSFCPKNKRQGGPPFGWTGLNSLSQIAVSKSPLKDGVGSIARLYKAGLGPAAVGPFSGG